MNFQDMVNKGSEGLVPILANRIREQGGGRWYYAFGSHTKWFPSALTRIALLVGDQEVRWLWGDDEIKQLIIVADKMLISLDAPDSDEGDARVVARRLGDLRRVDLKGGQTSFGDARANSYWPGQVSITWHFEDGDSFAVEDLDMAASGIDEVWSDLLPGTSA